MEISIFLIFIVCILLISFFISCVIQRTSLIILRRRLKAVMHNNVEITSFLSLFAQNMQHKEDLENWAHRTARYVADYIEAQSTCIFLRDGDYLRPEGVSGMFPLLQRSTTQYAMTKPKHLSEQLKNERIRVGHGIIGLAVQNKTDMIFNDPAEFQDLLYQKESILPIDCIMVVPLVSEGVCQGAICAINTKQENGQIFTSDQFSRFRFIAGQVELARSIMDAYQKLSRQQHLESELEFARNLQRSLLPETVPLWGQFSVHAFTRSSKEVSGDFYDFVQLDDDRLLVVIGDACGKGIPACMIMSMTRSFIRANVKRYTSLMALMLELNDNLYRDAGAGRYITLGVCILNRKTSTFEYARGGHTELLLYTHQHIRPIYPDGAGIGLLPSEDVEFDTMSTEFSPGMSLLLFTDGINEAVSPKNNEQFGVKRLSELYQESCISNEDPQVFMEKIIKRVDEFAETPNGDGQQDDQTLVLIHHV